MLLRHNFHLFGGYLVVTARYVVVTAPYLVVTGGYCSLPLGTAPFHFQYERTQYTYTFQQQQQFIVRKKHYVLEQGF